MVGKVAVVILGLLSFRVQQDSFTPEAKDLIKIGVASNIAMGHVKQCSRLYLDSVDFQSPAHARFAIECLERSNYKTQIQRAMDVISDWPQGTYKDKARKYLVALGRLQSTLMAAYASAAQSDYQSGAEEMNSGRKLLEAAMEDLTYLFTARGIPDWEQQAQKQVLLSDSNGIVHRETCKVADAALKASEAQFQKDGEVAYQKAAKEKGWDSRSLKRLTDWVKLKQGTRGKCPVVMPDYLKEAFIPKYMFACNPISVDEAKAMKQCPSCMK